MSVFSRMSDIVNANLHSMLDKAEDPEKMVRLIIQEMEDTLVEVRSTSVRTIARRKQVERDIQQVDADIAEWTGKAELAMRREREDLARSALVYRGQLKEKHAELNKELGILNEELAKLDSDVAQLNAKLKDARARQKSMVVRKDSATSRLKAKRQLDENRLADAMGRFEHYERRIDTLEAQVEAEELGRGKTLADEIAELETSEEVDAELKALRERLKTEQ